MSARGVPGGPQGETPAALPLSLSNLDTLRALVLSAHGAADDLVWVASDAVSPEPVCTPEAARIDIDRHGGELRRTLRAAKVEVEALAALFRLAEDPRRQIKVVAAERHRGGKAGGR